MSDLIVKGGEPKTLKLEDGFHTGKVVRLEERTPDGKDYSYVDIFILLSGEVGEIKVGYPLPKNTLSEKSDLGKLVKRFTGENIVKDKEYNLKEMFSGKAVGFVTLQNEDGFANISKESLKPAIGTESGQ